MVLAVDADHGLVHVDHPIPASPPAKWSWDGQPIDVEHVEGYLLTVEAASQLEFGHVLTQHRVLSSCSHIHAALLDYWRQTWCNWADVDADTWTRIKNFFTAYVPALALKLPLLNFPNGRGPYAGFGLLLHVGWTDFHMWVY